MKAYGSGFIRVAALLMTALMLASCVVEEIPGPGPRPPMPGPVACTREYAPVCGQRGPNHRTFANACMAHAQGYRIDYRGECRRGPDRPGRPQMCTQEYNPVCAQRGGRHRTFSNACMARAEGYRVDYRGECRRGPDRPGRPDRPQFCTREYAPVCARRGSSIRTFGNACEAEAARYRIISRGRC